MIFLVVIGQRPGRTQAGGRGARFSPERAASSSNSVAPLRGRRGKGGADHEGQPCSVSYVRRGVRWTGRRPRVALGLHLG